VSALFGDYAAVLTISFSAMGGVARRRGGQCLTVWTLVAALTLALRVPLGEASLHSPFSAGTLATEAQVPLLQNLTLRRRAAAAATTTAATVDTVSDVAMADSLVSQAVIVEMLADAAEKLVAARTHATSMKRALEISQLLKKHSVRTASELHTMKPEDVVNTFKVHMRKAHSTGLVAEKMDPLAIDAMPVVKLDAMIARTHLRRSHIAAIPAAPAAAAAATAVSAATTTTTTLAKTPSIGMAAATPLAPADAAVASAPVPAEPVFTRDTPRLDPAVTRASSAIADTPAPVTLRDVARSDSTSAIARASPANAGTPAPAVPKAASASAMPPPAPRSSEEDAARAVEIAIILLKSGVRTASELRKMTRSDILNTAKAELMTLSLADQSKLGIAAPIDMVVISIATLKAAMSSVTAGV